MHTLLHKGFTSALVLFIGLYFLSTVWKSHLVNELLSLMGFLMLVFIFLSRPKQNIILPLLLLFLSIVVTFVTSSPLHVLWTGLREMKAIIPLIIFISLVSWMISHRPYVKALMMIGKKRLTTTTRFYAYVGAMTHFISSFMTLGGIAFVYQLFGKAKKAAASESAWNYILSTAIMRGFTLTVLWTTVHPAFAYVIGGTNAPLVPTVLKGIGLAVIGFVISIIIFRIQMKRKQISTDLVPDLDIRSDEKLEGLVGTFIFWLALLMGGIIILNQWLGVDIMLTVPVVIVVVTTLYFISNRDLVTYKQHWTKLVNDDLGKKKKEMLLILSAGILVGTLKETGYGSVLFSYFLTSVDWLNLNILIGLTLVVILLGFCGFPPIPAMVLLSGILVDLPGNYSPDMIALSLLLGVSVTLVTAPVTVPLLLISSLNERSLAENGIRSNLLFGMTLLVVGILYIQCLSFF